MFSPFTFSVVIDIVGPSFIICSLFSVFFMLLNVLLLALHFFFSIFFWVNWYLYYPILVSLLPFGLYILVLLLAVALGIKYVSLTQHGLCSIKKQANKQNLNYFFSSVRNFQQYVFNIPILCVYILYKPSKQCYHSSFKQLYVFQKIEILASVVVHIIYQAQFSLFLLLNTNFT